MIALLVLAYVIIGFVFSSTFARWCVRNQQLKDSDLPLVVLFTGVLWPIGLVLTVVGTIAGLWMKRVHS